MPLKKTSALAVFTTVSKKSDAVRLSKILVEKKLAACVTTLPLGESRYRWKGKICNEREFVLLIKTTVPLFERLRAVLERIHPYDCPEILGIPVEKISKPYRDWLIKSVGG